MKSISEIQQEASWMRRRVLELARQAGANGCHVGGSLSLVDILASLYAIVDVNNFEDCRDRVILSKGHGAMALYCALERYGVLTKEEVDTFEVNGTHYYSHASRNINKGIEFSGGSLGLGLSYGVGVALSCKERNLNNHIYVILGDGECNEGIVWESIMSINKLKLHNITIIVDCNGLQADGSTFDVMDMTPMAEKFSAFGLSVVEVDGHNVGELLQALQDKNQKKAQVIIAHTVKGKGVSFLENQPTSHHCVINQKKFESALNELNQ